jgi:hypothetical protein
VGRSGQRAGRTAKQVAGEGAGVPDAERDDEPGRVRQVCKPGVA